MKAITDFLLMLVSAIFGLLFMIIQGIIEIFKSFFGLF